MNIEAIKKLVRTQNSFYLHPNISGVLFFEKWLPQVNIGRTFAWISDLDIICTLNHNHPSIAAYSKYLGSDAWVCGPGVPAPCMQLAYSTMWSLYDGDGGITAKSLAEGANDKITANAGVITALQAEDDLPSEFLKILREKGMAIPSDHPELAEKFAKRYNIPIVNISPDEIESGFVGSENQIEYDSGSVVEGEMQ